MKDLVAEISKALNGYSHFFAGNLFLAWISLILGVWLLFWKSRSRSGVGWVEYLASSALLPNALDLLSAKQVALLAAIALMAFLGCYWRSIPLVKLNFESYDRPRHKTTAIAFLGIPIQPEEIIDLLKREVLFKDICRKILSQKIITRSAQEKGIAVAPEEIRAEANKIRYHSATNRTIWLTEQMITPEDWEAGIRDRLLAQKLAEHLFAKKVDRFFVLNRSSFDRFVLYQILVADEQLARHLVEQIKAKELSFYEAAHRYHLDEQRRYQCGYEGTLSLGHLPLELATVVFRAPVGKVLGPVKSDRGYHLLMVEAFVPDELNSAKRQDILELLFKDWLSNELALGFHFKTLENRCFSPFLR